MTEPETEPDTWKTTALNFAGIIIEYDKLVCRLVDAGGSDEQSQHIHLLLRTLMKSVSSQHTSLKAVVVIPNPSV